jgi:hypothetical protein
LVLRNPIRQKKKMRILKNFFSRQLPSNKAYKRVPILEFFKETAASLVHKKRREAATEVRYYAGSGFLGAVLLQCGIGAEGGVHIHGENKLKNDT